MKKIFFLFVFFSLFIFGCSHSLNLDDFFNDVKAIDINYSLSINDYSKGLSWLNYHLRERPMNLDDFTTVISDFNNLKMKYKTSDDFDFISNYIDVRVSLLYAEKYLKKSNNLRGTIKNGFSCSDEKYFNETYQYRIMAYNKGNQSLKLVEKFKENYPLEFSKLGFDQLFFIEYEKSLKYISDLTKADLTIFQKNCN